MKRFVTLVVTTAVMLAGHCLAKKDRSNDYQIGTFVAFTAVDDGSITSTIRGDGTTVAGGVYANHVGVYRIDAADGTWYVETMRQSQDSMLRGLGMTPTHLKAEKANPLDGLKNGDKVMFRLEQHHKLNGTETDMYIPSADNPKKEVKFVTRFVPKVSVRQPQPNKPTDNVKAMCDSGRLSPELQKQYCTQSSK